MNNIIMFFLAFNIVLGIVIGWFTKIPWLKKWYKEFHERMDQIQALSNRVLTYNLKQTSIDTLKEVDQEMYEKMKRGMKQAQPESDYSDEQLQKSWNGTAWHKVILDKIVRLQNADPKSNNS